MHIFYFTTLRHPLLMWEGIKNTLLCLFKVFTSDDFQRGVSKTISLTSLNAFYYPISSSDQSLPPKHPYFGLDQNAIAQAER